MSNLDNVADLMNDDDSRVNLAPVWAAINSPIYRVVDEEGVNAFEAKIRRLSNEHWLYVDDSDGYQIMGDSDVSRLLCVPEADHVPMGWDHAGNVAPM